MIVVDCTCSGEVDSTSVGGIESTSTALTTGHKFVTNLLAP